jgi:hypothetical protein
MSKTVWLRTTCETELWAGFFGIDETGRQPECDQEILEELEEDSLEIEEDGTMRPCYSVQCPKCKTWLEWPHAWYLVQNLELT